LGANCSCGPSRQDPSPRRAAALTGRPCARAPAPGAASAQDSALGCLGSGWSGEGATTGCRSSLSLDVLSTSQHQISYLVDSIPMRSGASTWWRSPKPCYYSPPIPAQKRAMSQHCPISFGQEEEFQLQVLQRRARDLRSPGNAHRGNRAGDLVVAAWWKDVETHSYQQV
jgi:hypothetical protein